METKRKKIVKMKRIPMMPLRGLMIFPHMALHFDVGRPRSVAALEAAMIDEQRIFLVAQKDAETENPGQDDIYQVGTIAQIKQVLNLPGNSLRVLVEGIQRGSVLGRVCSAYCIFRCRTGKCTAGIDAHGTGAI